MNNILSLLLVALSVQPLMAQDATLQRQQQTALQAAQATGQSPQVCLKAVIIYEWCVAHPQGGTFNGVPYDATGTAVLLNKSMQVLSGQPGATPPPAQPRMSGGIADRGTRAVGRSASDPKRAAEMAARLERSQMQQQQGAAGGLQQTIAQAMAAHRMLVITYDNGAEGRRLIEPYLLGVTSAGHPAIHAWFTGGASASGDGPGWRNYLLAKIISIEVSPQMFTGRNFDPAGGGIFQSVQTTFSPLIKIY